MAREKKGILFLGYFGFGNLGDEAVLAAELAAFSKHFPACRPVVISGNPSYTEQLHGVKAVPRMKPRLLIEQMKSAAMLICGGGSLLQDITSLRSVLYYLGVVRLARFFKVPVFFYGQGVGPLKRNISRYLVGKVANGVQSITVRDERSLELMKEIGVHRPEIQLAADPVFSLKRERDINGKLFNGGPVNGKPVVGIAPRLWSGADYLQVLARIMEGLRQKLGFHIVYLPFHKPEDEQACRIMLEAGLQGEVWEEQLSPSSTIPLLTALDLLVGVRLHALIFGCLAGVPIIGISYDPKVR
ncbi:MAG: polysaccharide pyruvyl transferase CsaB, partial [Halanaerobium sp.]|nr:polysaccharide pyruvyl transferase CsaB [Halanaerobium sp.]